MIGVAAGRFHTVLWTREAVYTMGLNGGQLGKLRYTSRVQTVLLHILVKNKYCNVTAAQCVFTLDPVEEKIQKDAELLSVDFTVILADCIIIVYH